MAKTINSKCGQVLKLKKKKKWLWLLERTTDQTNEGQLAFTPPVKIIL